MRLARFAPTHENNAHHTFRASKTICYCRSRIWQMKKNQQQQQQQQNNESSASGKDYYE